MVAIGGNLLNRVESMGCMVRKRRALLTESEREYISDKSQTDPRYVAISRVRKKITEELPKDLEILREHHEDLYNELQAVVCDLEEE